VDIREIGKPGLISRLTADIKPAQPSTLMGVGDDAAILCYGDTALAATTCTFLESIHFDLTYVPLQHLGYKAASIAFSNLYAMNAIPRQLLVSIAVSSKFSVEALERLYKGIKHACERHQVDLVGGETTLSVTGLVITVTAIGEAEPSKVTFRHTAQKGDLICVSGNLGAAYMGLQVLEREKKLFEDDPTTQPQLNDYSYVVGRWLKPEARRDITGFFAFASLLPTSMIDISNGLSSDLLCICAASGVGCEIHCHKIPIADETIAVAGELFLEPLITALNGGFDYELLFTISVTDYDKAAGNGDISIIGYITGKDESCYLVTESGEKINLITE